MLLEGRGCGGGERRGGEAPINLSVTWQLWDVITILPEALDKWTDSPSYRMIEKQARFLLGPLKGYAPDLNDFVTPQLAAHAYDYLGLLWLFTGLTILGALVPLYKYIPEEELLYPEYEFEEEAAPAPAPAAMGDMLKEEGGMMAPEGMMQYSGNTMQYAGDMMKEGASSEKPPADEGEADGEQDYSYYDYQYGGGLPNTQVSYDYYDFGGAGKRKDKSGYPPPHHLWQHALGHHHRSGHSPSRH